MSKGFGKSGDREMGWAARAKTEKKTGQFKITSVKFLSNAYLTEEEYEKLELPFFNEFPKQHRFMVLMVSLKIGNENKTVFCCQAGFDDKTLEFTQIGSATLCALTHFIPKKGNEIIWVPMTKCLSATYVKNRVMTILMVAKHGDGICFTGDMAGECDGKIIPEVLKPDGTVEGIRFDEHYSAALEEVLH